MHVRSLSPQSRTCPSSALNALRAGRRPLLLFSLACACSTPAPALLHCKCSALDLLAGLQLRLLRVLSFLRQVVPLVQPLYSQIPQTSSSSSLSNCNQPVLPLCHHTLSSTSNSASILHRLCIVFAFTFTILSQMPPKCLLLRRFKSRQMPATSCGRRFRPTIQNRRNTCLSLPKDGQPLKNDPLGKRRNSRLKRKSFR